MYINIIKGQEFISANQVIQGTIRLMKEQGLDTTKHKEAINPTDMKKMKESLNSSTPQGLQDKVFLDIVLHFARRGREGLRELKRGSIVIRKDAEGVKYATPAYNELDKNHTGLNPKIKDPKKVMYAEDNADCPVRALDKYLTKLNPNCDAFFQRPKVKKIPDGCWYDNVPVGKNTLAGKVAKISQAAGCSENYTNHCLRATATTVLSHAGVSPTDICSVTGHSSVESLKHYVAGPSMEQRANMSHILHQYGRPAASNKPQQTSTSQSLVSSEPGPSNPASLPVENSPQPGPSSQIDEYVRENSPPRSVLSPRQSPPSTNVPASMQVQTNQTLNVVTSSDNSALRSILSGNNFYGSVNFYFK